MAEGFKEQVFEVFKERIAVRARLAREKSNARLTKSASFAESSHRVAASRVDLSEASIKDTIRENYIGNHEAHASSHPPPESVEASTSVIPDMISTVGNISR